MTVYNAHDRGICSTRRRLRAKLPGLGLTLPPTGGGNSFFPRADLIAVTQTPESRRRRIWEIASSFHCSIIGTCLTTGELRQILVKMQLPGADRETDHELHGRAVLLSVRKEPASKLLQKALDRRHRTMLNRFGRARTAEELRALWAIAVERAEIPGAYWAVLTHPHATEDLVRHAFGEVHMLSHLVGAANRADIRHLRELEAENARLQEQVARQQKHLRDAVVSRDATIASLNEALAKAIAAGQEPPSARGATDATEHATASDIAADLRRRLAAEIARRDRADRRLRTMTEERDCERKQRQALQRRQDELREEIETAELALAQLLPAPEPDDEVSKDLAGATLLYVGGRTRPIAQLRRLAERWNATLLYHDGGIDDRSGLLEAQVARADRTLFPVDHISHNAVAIVKRVCRSAGKPYLVLRNSGLTAFAAALRSLAAEPQTASGRQAEQIRSTA
jgi:uncharacterized protein DUF2325